MTWYDMPIVVHVNSSIINPIQQVPNPGPWGVVNMHDGVHVQINYLFSLI